MCPIEASTVNSPPRKPSMVRALAGLSTMTSGLAIAAKDCACPDHVVNRGPGWHPRRDGPRCRHRPRPRPPQRGAHDRSEEHTSELQSQFHLVCRLLLEKKKKKKNNN